MINEFLKFAESRLVGFTIPETQFRLNEIIGNGKIGVVFKAIRFLTPEIHDTVAIKIIKRERLRKNWEDEIVKMSKLRGNVRVPRYIHHGTFHVDNEVLAYIVYEYIQSQNLRNWLKSGKPTIPFIEGLILEILHLFHAMKTIRVEHNDLHSGNVLVARDIQEIEPDLEHFYVTDFGIGGSANDLPPKNDYFGLAEVINETLERVDFSELSKRDREKFVVIKGFVKDISEQDPTVASTPANLRSALKDLLDRVEERDTYGESTLTDPFEYLSCEQIGDSFTLLTKLYSRDFLGRNDLIERNNTIFTGPRGCGKTTVFRNLSAQVSLLGGSDQSNDFIGIYYQCIDLFFAFPYLYLRGDLSERGLRVTAAYFNLSLLSEMLQYLSLLGTQPHSPVSQEETTAALRELRTVVDASTMPPVFHSRPLDVWLTWIEMQKRSLRRAKLDSEDEGQREGYEELDFLKKACMVLQKRIRHFGRRPFFFFIDDYSFPKIPVNLQRSLHRIVFQRNAECFFKVSTESITSLAPEDATGKVIELSREYDVIDLGSYFLNSESTIRMKFITEIVNNRLKLCKDISYKDITKILGSNPISDTALARRLRTSSKKGKRRKTMYFGVEVFVDLCSGEIGLMLRMLKEMFIAANKKGGGSSKIEFERLPIEKTIQDKAIREMGNDFLIRVDSAPETGNRMREIVEAFADVSSFALRMNSSKNQDTNPPKLATKIELREPPKFLPPHDSLRRIYDDLIRYSVFLRDVRGKSIRGAVVPRLFLRRLLIPTFHLTFSKRDNIGLEVDEFYTLLSDPSTFAKTMKKKFRKAPQASLFADMN